MIIVQVGGHTGITILDGHCPINNVWIIMYEGYYPETGIILLVGNIMDNHLHSTIERV